MVVPRGLTSGKGRSQDVCANAGQNASNSNAVRRMGNYRWIRNKSKAGFRNLCPTEARFVEELGQVQRL
jgi:hypothetical protein